MMTASEYAQELNEKYGCNLVTDAAHWEYYGIQTADDLGQYLDACSASNDEDYYNDGEE